MLERIEVCLSFLHSFTLVVVVRQGHTHPLYPVTQACISMTFNACPSCLYLPSTGIASMGQQA